MFHQVYQGDAFKNIKPNFIIYEDRFAVPSDREIKFFRDKRKFMIAYFRYPDGFFYDNRKDIVIDPKSNQGRMYKMMRIQVENEL